MIGLAVVNVLFYLGLLGRFVELRRAIGFGASSPYVVIAKRRFGAAIIWVAALTTISVSMLNR